MAQPEYDTDEPGRPPIRGMPWVLVTLAALIIGLVIAFTAMNPSSGTNNAADTTYQENNATSIPDPASTQTVK